MQSSAPMTDLLLAARAKGRFQRRLFLKAIGMGLSAPLAYQVVRSATAQTAGRPKRFMVYYVPHGVPPEHSNPTGQGTNYSFMSGGEALFSPLEPYKHLINVYQGFKYPGGGTHENVNKFLSGLHAANNDEQTPRTTIEHFIARELGYDALALGAVPHPIFGPDIRGKVFWDGQAIIPQKSPLVAYSELFGGMSPGPSGPSTTDELQSQLYALTSSDIESLQATLTDLPGERSKLQVHLESIQSLKASLDGGGNGNVSSCGGAPSLPAVDALRAKAGSQSDEWFLKEENFADIMTAHLQIAAAAMVCNIRPVVAFQNLYSVCEINSTFVGMGITGSHHNDLSHDGPQSTGNGLALEPRREFAIAQRWFIQKLVDNVITALDVDDPADPGHTVLENTTILLCSEIGEGAWHTTCTKDIMGMLSYMPIITIGGAGGALKTGELHTLHKIGGQDDNPADRPAADLWLTLAQAMGVSATSFGGSSSPFMEVKA